MALSTNTINSTIEWAKKLSLAVTTYGFAPLNHARPT
jgi:hypothetical protein